jgi:hypothetical protein
MPLEFGGSLIEAVTSPFQPVFENDGTMPMPVTSIDTMPLSPLTIDTMSLLLPQQSFQSSTAVTESFNLPDTRRITEVGEAHISDLNYGALPIDEDTHASATADEERLSTDDGNEDSTLTRSDSHEGETFFPPHMERPVLQNMRELMERPFNAPGYGTCKLKQRRNAVGSHTATISDSLRLRGGNTSDVSTAVRAIAGRRPRGRGKKALSELQIARGHAGAKGKASPKSTEKKKVAMKRKIKVKKEAGSDDEWHPNRV